MMSGGQTGCQGPGTLGVFHCSYIPVPQISSKVPEVGRSRITPSSQLRMASEMMSPVTYAGHREVPGSWGADLTEVAKPMLQLLLPCPPTHMHAKGSILRDLISASSGAPGP